MASYTTSLLVALLCLLNGSGRSAAECDNVTALSSQVDSLLALVDRETPPAAPVTVAASFDVRHASVYERDTSMRLLADLTIKWEDSRLTWNATEWDCGSWLTSAERLWLPDIVLLNGAASSTVDSSLRARISSDGAVTWVKRLDISTPISMRLTNWPRDSQDCRVVFGSRMYSSDELRLLLQDSEHALVYESDSWEVVSVVGGSGSWDRGVANSQVATWTVVVRRRAPAHALAAGTVLFTTVLLLVAASALPPASRAPLAAAAALIGAVWMTGTVGRLPGAYLGPRVLSLASCACGLAAASCAVSALVVRLPRCTASPPRCLRSLLSYLSGVCDLKPQLQDSEVSSEQSAAWAATARLLDWVHLAALYFTIIIILALYIF